MIHSFKLRFNTDKPNQAKAWETLQSLPAGGKNKFILAAICAYADRLTAEEEKQLFLRDVLTTIDNALRNAGSISISAGAPVQQSAPTGETAAVIDDFLSNL